MRLDGHDARLLFTETQIRQRVESMAATLRQRLEGDCPVFVGILHGGFVFLADLIRAYGAPHEIDFLKVSRHDPANREPSALRVLQDLRGDVRGRTIVVVEAIRAHGTKIEYVERFLSLHAPARILYCALVVPEHANRSIPVDEAGFEIGREYVVGYGLDLHERHRQLGFIAALETGPDGAPRAQGVA